VHPSECHTFGAAWRLDDLSRLRLDPRLRRLRLLAWAPFEWLELCESGPPLHVDVRRDGRPRPSTGFAAGASAEPRPSRNAITIKLSPSAIEPATRRGRLVESLGSFRVARSPSAPTLHRVAGGARHGLSVLGLPLPRRVRAG
jgi:hypothetical protein